MAGRYRDLLAPFWPIFHFFFILYPLPSVHLQNLRFVSLAIPEILGGPKIRNLGHVEGHAPSWPIFTALHAIQMRSSNENSVCPSVRHTRAL